MRRWDESVHLTGEWGLVGNPASWVGLVARGGSVPAWQVSAFQGWSGPAAAQGWTRGGSRAGLCSPRTGSQRVGGGVFSLAP